MSKIAITPGFDTVAHGKSLISDPEGYAVFGMRFLSVGKKKIAQHHRKTNKKQ